MMVLTFKSLKAVVALLLLILVGKQADARPVRAQGGPRWISEEEALARGCVPNGIPPNGRITTVCRFGNEQQNRYATRTTPMNRVREDDACGACIGDTFIDDSILINLPREEGEEEMEAHLATYNVTFLETGIVALAASSDVIEAVTCSPRNVEIVFSNPIESELIPQMFPESAVLAVDGLRFGKCNVWESDEDDPFESGFLIVTSVILSGSNSIIVSGEPSFFNYLFQERDILYKPLPDQFLRGRQRELVTITYSKTKEFLEDSPITIEIGIEVTADIRFRMVRDYWRLVGRRWWDWDPYVDFLWDFSAKLEAEATATAGISATAGWDYDQEIDWIEFPIPGAGFRLPRAVTRVINRVLPDDIEIKAAVGVGVEIPAYFSVEIEYEASFGLEAVATLNFSTGQKAIQFGVRGRPIRGLNYIFEVTENGDASGGVSFTPPNPTEPSFELTLTLFGGVKPKLVLDALGFASAKLGVTSGLEASATLFAPHEEPSDEGLFCDMCHYGELEFTGVILRNPFFAYKVIGGDEEEVDLVDLEITQDLFKMCFLEEEDCVNTEGPTSGPTSAPSTLPPTGGPTANPTGGPTSVPTPDTSVPPSSGFPTDSLADTPTDGPTGSPTSVPTSSPITITSHPTSAPTDNPTSDPTDAPTSVPTSLPTYSGPADDPTSAPTDAPTDGPTSGPTSLPTTPDSSTSRPTSVPSSVPTSVPTSAPTSDPTSGPTSTPTSNPTSGPTSSPTLNPTPSTLPPIDAPITPEIPPATPPSLSDSPSSVPTTSF